MAKIKLIFSCDDGRKEMLVVAKLLEKYGFKGTFYIAPYEKGMDLTIKELQYLSRKHIVGGHTLTHQRLTDCDLSQAKVEIEMGKSELEKMIGKKVTKFSTPRGWYNDDIIELIKNAGYKEHRTTKMGITNLKGYDNFHLPVSAHFYPRPEYKEKGVYQSIIDKYEEARTGGYFNVLIHTKELTEYEYWEMLDKVLFYIKERELCKY